MKASVQFTNTISPIDRKVVESDDFDNKNVENMFDEDGEEQGGEEGKKRKKTGEEELGQRSVREQPGQAYKRRVAKMTATMCSIRRRTARTYQLYP